MTENLAQLFLTRAAERPDLRIGTLDEQLALPDALRRAAGGAQRLRGLGLDEQHRVAIVASSSTDYLVVWMACVLAGVPVALVNPTYPPDLLARMLDDSTRPWSSPTCRHRVRRDRARRCPSRQSREWPDADPADTPGVDADRFDLVSFMHTSGTTGRPEVLRADPRVLPAPRPRHRRRVELTAADRVLAPLPLFHINPLGYGIIGALTAGADALDRARSSPPAGSGRPCASTESPRWSLHAPPVEILKRATTAEDAAGHRVRTMFYADGEFMARFGVPLAVSGYGSTEAAGVSHLHRGGSATTSRPTPAATAGDPRRHRGPARRRRADPRPGARARHAVRRLLRRRQARPAPATPTAGSPPATSGAATSRRANACVFLERAAESIRVKGEFVPIPFVEERLGTIAELATWRCGRSPASSSTTRSCCTWWPTRCPSTQIRAVAQPSCPPSCAPATSPGSARSRATPPPARCSAGSCTALEVLSWTTL